MMSLHSEPIDQPCPLFVGQACNHRISMRVSHAQIDSFHCPYVMERMQNGGPGSVLFDCAFMPCVEEIHSQPVLNQARLSLNRADAIWMDYPGLSAGWIRACTAALTRLGPWWAHLHFEPGACKVLSASVWGLWALKQKTKFNLGKL